MDPLRSSRCLRSSTSCDQVIEIKLGAAGAPAAPNLISMTWSQLVEDLKQREDLKGSMLLANKYQKPEIFKDSDGPHKLAEMLLFREFMRRPKRQNSLETQGLVKVDYLGLDKVQASPTYW